MLLLAAIAWPASAADIAHGNYMGSGRACYGMLTITAAGITWMTPFSQCRTSPYAIVARRDEPGALRVTYQLTRRSASCPYHVLVLTHDGGDADIGWNVIGYPSLISATENQRDEALGCYLYRH